MLKRRNLALRLSLACLACVPLLLPWIPSASSGTLPAEPPLQNAKPATFQFTGPGSCSSSSCHGSVRPLEIARVRQNEYSVWVLQDQHAKAFEVLSSPVSQRMAKLLGLGAAEAAPQCLSCHALHVPEAQRGRTFSLHDGVSCENCHGPASAWLGPHTTKGWTHQQSLGLGMYDTKNLARRAEQCLSCHLGTAEKSVDHAMLAAGHPDLYFELDSFTAVMPPHWSEPAAENDGAQNARAWGIGQAVQLRESLRQLERRARSGAWPEYAELRCYSCHHALTEPEKSWRQQLGYQGRSPGDPAWNASRYAVFRPLAAMADRDTAARLHAEIEQLDKLISRRTSDPAAVAAAASRAGSLADSLVARVQAMAFDQNLVLRLQHQICSNAAEIAGEGERAAEQAAMALHTLFLAHGKSTRSSRSEELRAAIQQLFQQVRTPASYRPDSFAAQMKKVQALLDSTQ